MRRLNDEKVAPDTFNESPIDLILKTLQVDADLNKFMVNEPTLKTLVVFSSSAGDIQLTTEQRLVMLM